MTTDDDTFEVRDRDRTLHITGVKLAESSSFRPGKRRWIDLSLYRSSAGVYIVAGVGGSDMPGERPRHWAHQCNAAEGVLEQLYMYDENETRYLTDVARQLLTEAGRHDEDIRAAYAVEHVA